jgi:hypothetical protein
VTEHTPAKTGEYLGDIPQFSKDPACCKKYMQDNKHDSLHLTLKICLDICPWTFISVPQSLQFSSSFALGKLFVSHYRSRWCQMKAIVYLFSLL